MNNYNKLKINDLKQYNIVEFIFKNKPIICNIESIDINTNKIEVSKLVREETQWVTDYEYFKTKSTFKSFDVDKKPLKIIGYSPEVDGGGFEILDSNFF
tara:strand:+ start:272 stop:568 length:297 start_codon:yes stop_codon:yes gene_type:complete